METSHLKVNCYPKWMSNLLLDYGWIQTHMLWDLKAPKVHLIPFYHSGVSQDLYSIYV